MAGKNERKKLAQELIADMHQIRRVMGHPAGKRESITTSQWSVLALLMHKDSLSVKELSQSLKVSSSAATQLADGLVKSGHIERHEDPRDRRLVRLTLSKRTAQKIARMRGEYEQKLLRAFEALTDAEFKQYVALNKKIAATVLDTKKIK